MDSSERGARGPFLLQERREKRPRSIETKFKVKRESCGVIVGEIGKRAKGRKKKTFRPGRSKKKKLRTRKKGLGTKP